MTVSEHFHFMQMAMDKARQGIEKGQTPFGACLVKDGLVVACEHNRVLEATDITAHAEMAAIRVACRDLGLVDLSGSVMYTTCEPCPMCFSACHAAKISKIVYGVTMDDIHKAGFSGLNISNHEMKQLGQSRIDIWPDFLREENLKVLDEWLRRKDKRIY